MSRRSEFNWQLIEEEQLLWEETWQGEIWQYICTIKKKLNVRWPSFKSGDSEQSHHGHEDVVKVEVAVVPHSLVDGWLVDVSVLVQDVGPPARRQHAAVRMGPTLGSTPTMEGRKTEGQTDLHSSGLDLASSVQR